MTTFSSKPVAVADAKHTVTILRRLHLSVFLTSLPFGMLVFGLPLIARALGASALAIGGLLAAYALIVVAVQPVVGYGLDHFGRRPFLLVGLLGYAFSNAIFGLTSDVGGLLLTYDQAEVNADGSVDAAPSSICAAPVWPSIEVRRDGWSWTPHYREMSAG